jgi:hypothetical protein
MRYAAWPGALIVELSPCVDQGQLRMNHEDADVHVCTYVRMCACVRVYVMPGLISIQRPQFVG